MKAEELTRLEGEARYASDRFRLYRARAYSGRPTSPGRFRELERVSDQAEARLRAAKARRNDPDSRQSKETNDRRHGHGRGR